MQKFGHQPKELTFIGLQPEIRNGNPMVEVDNIPIFLPPTPFRLLLLMGEALAQGDKWLTAEQLYQPPQFVCRYLYHLKQRTHSTAWSYTKVARYRQTAMQLLDWPIYECKTGGEIGKPQDYYYGLFAGPEAVWFSPQVSQFFDDTSRQKFDAIVAQRVRCQDVIYLPMGIPKREDGPKVEVSSEKSER